MWVTQTFLGNPEPDADLFVYYLFENYAKDQKKFTRNLQGSMEDLGEMFGPRVSLFAPNSRFAAKIGGELRDIRDLWGTFAGRLPGLLVSTCPLSEFDKSSGTYHFFSLKNLSKDEAGKVIGHVRQLADEQIDWCRANDTRTVSESLWRRLYGALEMKPGIFGFKVDLKKLGKF